MKKLLVLALSDSIALTNLNGESILKDFPVPVLALVDIKNARFFADLDNVEVEVVRFYDEPSIHARVKRAQDEHGLLGIAAFGESGIELAAAVRERLDVPGMHSQIANRFRNKLVMKTLLSDAGVRVPEYLVCSERDRVEALLEKHGKLIIKPVDGVGSKGLAIIHSRAELDAWYATWNAARFEAEEYIEGTMYHVNSIMVDGEAIFTACGLYLPGMANIDYTSSAPFSTTMLTSGELKDRLEAFANNAVRCLGMLNGVSHLECFVRPDGEIVFCEVAARPPGGGIVLLMEAQFGVHYSRAALLLAAGRADLITTENVKRDAVAGVVGFRNGNAGFIKYMPKAAAFKEDWVHHVGITRREGDFIGLPFNCGDLIGTVILSAPDFDTFEHRRIDLCQRFFSELELAKVF